MVPVLRDQWTSLWRDFEDSFEPEVVTAVSSPVGVLATGGVIAVALAVIGYVPPIAGKAAIEAPWIGVALALVAASLSYLAWRRKCRGAIGVTATLFDTPFYSAAFVYTSATAHQGFGLALAALHGLMLIGAQAQHYALTPLFGVVVALPTAIVVATTRPPLATSVALISTVLVAWGVSYQTGQRHKLLRAKRQAEEALAVAGRLADDSMAAVLGTTLLNLSDFLHDLRNAQTVVRTNLCVIESTASLDEGTRAALDDALEGHRMESELVRNTLKKLREQAGPASEPFAVGETIAGAVARFTGRLSLSVEDETGGFEVRGRAEYLESILKNLFRNAEQAGAKRLWVAATVEGGADAIMVRIHDDGPGIPTAVRDRAFATLSMSTRAGGTGLGLYLVRRYTELLGGSVSMQDGPRGGAEIRLRLPGRSLLQPPSLRAPTVH